MVLQIFIFIGVLAVLVLVHEFGHFIVARRAGIKVDEFGFGFPPRLFSWKGKLTTYSLNAIPLGGFVKLHGEDGSATSDPKSFASKSARVRAAVLIAGVGMNLLLAAVLLSIGFTFGLPIVLGESGETHINVRDIRVHITHVAKDSPAFAAGLRGGEEIIVAEGFGTRAIDVRAGVQQSFLEKKSLTIKYRSEEEIQRVHIAPVVHPDTGKPFVGIGIVETGLISYPWYQALYKGAVGAGTMTKDVIVGFGTLLGNLFAGKSVGEGVTGPLGIAVLTGKIARQGVHYLLQFVAMLSVNLAVLNLIPFPALDGGRLLFVGLEKILRKPVTAALESRIHMIGFAVLMLVALLVTVRDVQSFTSFQFFSR